jgi:ABC-type glycerol-3-phosphate transport system substrate-binding protein
MAACGSDKKNESTTPSSAANKVNLAGTTITVDAVWSGDEQANFQKVLAQFEQQTGAKVQFTSTGDDIAAVLGTAIQGGSPPDVAILPQPGLLKDLTTQGKLQPLDDVVGKEVDANYSQSWKDLATVDGKLYGVWFKAANKSTMWFNSKAFEQAGVQQPKTWDDLQKTARTIADSGVTPISVGGADGWTLTDWFENVYLRSAGPEKYDQLSAHQIPWTDPSVKQALTTLGQVIGNESFLAGGRAGSLQTDFPGSVTKVFTDPPKAGIVYEGDFVALNIKKDTKAQLGTDANFFPFPSINGSKQMVTGGGDVAVLLKNSEGGKQLLKYLATPEAAEIWAAAGGFTSPNKNVKQSVYPDDITRRSAQELTDASVFRFDMSDLQPAAFGGTVGKGEWKILQDWLANPTAIDQTAQALEDARSQATK